MTFAQGYALLQHGWFGVMDVVYLVFCWRSVTIVRRSPDIRWKAHLRWLKPFLLASCISVFYRTFVNIQYFFGVRLGSGFDQFNRMVLLVSSGMAVVGAIRLFKVLKEQVPLPSLLHKQYEEWPEAASRQPGFAANNTAATDHNSWADK